MKTLFTLLLVLVFASGCATRRYDWDNYDGRLYQFYKNPSSADEFRVSMEKHFQVLESQKLRPAPGLYAELGTLYLERGDRQTAQVYYQRERDAWPESRYLMDAMLSQLQKPLKSKDQK